MNKPATTHQKAADQPKVNPAKLVHPRDFDREFTKLISQPEYTHQKAFDELDGIYQESFGRPRFSELKSYLNTRRNRLKAKR